MITKIIFKFLLQYFLRATFLILAEYDVEFSIEFQRQSNIYIRLI